MAGNSTRPVFLNLLHIHLPVMGVLSIIHRLTGVLLFAAIPVVIYLLALSLAGSAEFSCLLEFFDHDLVHVFMIFFIWGLAHHFFAGLRYFMIDLDIGVNRKQGRLSAWVVFALGFITMLIGVFTLL